MFQHPDFLSTLAFQRHAEFQQVAERRHRLFRRDLEAAPVRYAQVLDLPTAPVVAVAFACDTRVA